LESAHSIGFLYQHFLAGITEKSLNTFYHACSYAKADYSGFIFENVSKLFDHAAHNGCNYLNGHCFVSLMLCVPVWNHDKISYLAVPLGYRMWQKKESKLELAASMVRQVMPEFSSQKNVIILCDSWYTKQNLVSIVEEYPNLDLIGNARADSVIYDLAPAPTGRKGRPAKHGKRLSANDDFTLPCQMKKSMAIILV
jgi:hypothetical protein